MCIKVVHSDCKLGTYLYKGGFIKKAGTSTKPKKEFLQPDIELSTLDSPQRVDHSDTDTYDT